MTDIQQVVSALRDIGYILGCIFAVLVLMLVCKRMH